MDRRDRLIETGLDLARERSTEAVLRRIVELGVDLTDATYGALGVLEPGAKHLSRFITVGADPEVVAAIGDPPVGHGLLGVLIEQPEPLRVEVIGAHERSVGFPANHPPMTTMLGAPIVAHGVVLGDLYLTDKRNGAPFTDEDQAAVVILAAQAAIAIENARLHESARGRTRLLEAFRSIAIAILDGADPDATLERIASHAATLVGATHAVVTADGAEAATAEGPSIAASLRSGDAAFGALVATRAPGAAPFDDEDAEVLASFADQAAIALAHAQALAEARRALVLEDRERIAKELHDGVIQSLFAVGMGLQGSALLTAEPELAARIEGAVGEIDRAIRDLRNYIFGLRPGALADRQLDEALRGLATEFEERSGVVTAVEIDGHAAAELASAATDILQIAREGLSNVGRHARAATCRLSLRREDGAVVLEIDDDGEGFDPARGGTGMGLPNLRDRARALGGELSLDAAPGRGTLLRVTLPR